MNTLTTYGRVASDVTVKDVNGRACASFRFASGNKRKQPDGQYGTNWYNVSAWGSLADTASKFLKKGHRAAISGELVVRTYIGNTDNQTHYSIELDANSIDLVETKAEADAKSGASASAPAPASAAPQFTQVEDNSDLPF